MGEYKYTIERIEDGKYKITCDGWVEGSCVIVNHMGLVATILAGIIAYDEKF